MAVREIPPHVLTFLAGLQPENRPAGVFLLLGPTGTGKTKTVEAIAEILHGSEDRMLKIDCAEFQLSHEIAKLIGAPPGYTGHRETTPLLSEAKLKEVTSDRCPLSIILFDEIEKAAPSLHQILLGVLDKGIIHSGDNTTVNLRNSIVFMTSNLAAAEIMKYMQPGFGFSGGFPQSQMQSQIEQVALRAVSKFFSPEFVNRIDAVITYGTLSEDALHKILEQQVKNLQKRINARFQDGACCLKLKERTKRFLIDRANCAQYGARELNRVIHRHVTQPLAAMITRGEIPSVSQIVIDVKEDSSALRFNVEFVREVSLASSNPAVRMGFSFASV